LLKRRKESGTSAVLVGDIVNVLEATSSASYIMEGVLKTAWVKIRLESAWKMLQEDKVMQDIILARIRGVEEGKVRDKLMELEEIDKISVKKTIILKELEVKEHEFLDPFLDDWEVLVMGDSLVVETSTD
jgi:hypothetical protein